MKNIREIEETALQYKSLMAEAERVKAEKLALAERQRDCERSAEELKHCLEKLLEGQQFVSPRVTCRFSEKQTVHIVDPAKLAAKYLRVRTVTEPDKKAISEALKNGRKVAGAELVNELLIK